MSRIIELESFFSFATMLLTLSTLPVMAQHSPYISKVYEFTPAPGQFINTMPAYEDGDTPETIAEKCTERLANDNGEMVSLGGYGGYIVFGFDHTVENKSGVYDFSVLGNAYYASSNPNPDAVGREGGSAEPGIVMVSRDANGNGLPDDPWYELAGSEYGSAQTIHGYEITYTRSDENKERVPDPDNRAINDLTYCPWTDNQGGSGYVSRNTFHSQPYWPQWIAGQQMTFRGARLADNAVNEGTSSPYWVLYCYGFGYADNHPNNDAKHRSMFNIEWAVDEAGNHVWLDGIDFVKVYTAVNQYAGMVGEISTEVAGANDLHLLGQEIEDEYYTPASVRPAYVVDGKSVIHTLSGLRMSKASQPGLYIINGKKVFIN